MIDASIPFRAGTAGAFNLSDLLNQHQQRQMNERTMQQRDRQMDQQDQAFDLEMQQHTARLDAAQREAAAKGLEDIAAAVQWAQTPEQWAVVQQHYGRYDPQLATVPFEQREQVLVTTGRMKDYLEATKPEWHSVNEGGMGGFVGPDGSWQTVISPNPGTAQAGSPVGGGVQEGATATNPQTGERVQFRNGAWVPMGGGGGNAPGNFLGQ